MATRRRSGGQRRPNLHRVPDDGRRGRKTGHQGHDSNGFRRTGRRSLLHGHRRVRLCLLAARHRAGPDGERKEEGSGGVNVNGWS